ncbi:MAG: glycoside hydrolase family 9 protein [Acetatifactor sp.]|nr:glycoside hydrolase family 9 protein [Acetatifactor sp.]
MAIMVNQVGYEAHVASKKAVASQPGGYVLKNIAGDVIWQGQAGDAVQDPLCGETLYPLDFGSVQTAGKYYLENGAGECSDTFEIGKDVLAGVHNAMVKALYFQRCGCSLEEKYAGPYTHAACHMADCQVYGEPEHSFEARGGWHDAGDYGRYITPAAVTIGHLLYAYWLNTMAFREPLNIPESGNGVPDVLNECRYELEWMLKMQREDGGVYHKLTAWRHADFIMPEEDQDLFYDSPVSSLAEADFCACMALADRVYRGSSAARMIEKEFSLQLEAAARRAWKWLMEHPEPLLFTNPEGSNTGDYRDTTDADERLWAAAEMMCLAAWLREDTREYEDELRRILDTGLEVTDFGWTDVAGFAAMAVLTDASVKKTVGEDILQRFRKAVLAEADRLAELGEQNAFGMAMGAGDFCWGSNMVVTNRGILLALACRIAQPQSGETDSRIARYEEVIQAQIDYLLGKNITGYSFVTGFGDHAYRHPHLRTTAADGIDDPMAGWVAGGPNGKPGDELAVRMIPKGTPPMKCYLDREECYSLNEMTIYWNSSAVFVTAYLRCKVWEEGRV